MKKYFWFSAPVLTVLFMFGAPKLVAAAEWYVNYDSGTPNADCNDTNPCSTIEEVTVAGFSAGDTIYLAGTTDDAITLFTFSGTADNYTEIMVWPGQTMTATGAAAPVAMVVSNAMYLDISGITITGGGVGIDVNAGLGGEIGNLRFHDMHVSGAGIGLQIDGADTVSIYNMTIHENSIDGLYVVNSNNVTIYNSSSCNNTYTGINLDTVNTVVVANNVVCNNEMQGFGVTGAISTQFQNNIIYGNPVGMANVDGSTIQSDYNDFYGNDSIDGLFANLTDYQAATGLEAHSLEIDPMFVSTTDYHLQSGSLLIDAGSAVEGVGELDFDGEARPYGLAPDVGMDERPTLSAPTGLKVKNISAHTALVQWSMTEGYSVTKYRVQYSKKKNFNKSKVVKTTKTRVTLKKLKPETKYFVRVRAIFITDYAKYRSNWSASKKFTTKAVS